MSEIRIAFIGAGSYGFTFKLVADILSYPALKDCGFSFMDVDRTRLDNLKVILDRYFQMAGYKKQAVYTMNMEEALTGADFVINLVKIGFLEASVQDMDAAKKYGLYQTIGDTCGLAGVFRGLRTMAFDIKLCAAIEKFSSPKAVVINYTNPQSMLVMAASKTSRIPFIGLCHSVQGTTQMIAQYMNIPYSELRYEAAGINHMNWVTKLEHHGKDIYPEFRRLAKERGIFYGGYLKGNENDVLAGLGATRLDMLNRIGFMVTESSTHFPEYVPYYLRTPELRDQYKLVIDMFKTNIERKEKKYMDFVNQARKGELAIPERSNEYGSMIINSMVTNSLCMIYANVMNTGLVTNLPEFSSVEVACLVDGNGVQPCHYGALPTQLAMLCQMDISVHQLAVEAILKKDRQYVYWALMADPLTHSILNLDQIKEVADDLIGKQKEYLADYLG